MTNHNFRLYYIVLAGDYSGLTSGERHSKSSKLADDFCRRLQAWLAENNLKNGEDYGTISKLNFGQISMKCTEETSKKILAASANPLSGLTGIAELKLGRSADMSMAERITRPQASPAMGFSRGIA